MDTNKKGIKVCCICGRPFTGWGHNPWPIREDGECCDECNYSLVVPARIALATEKDFDAK
jgi:hypothetical protein